MNPTKRWLKKQKLAAPSRYYGDGGTIHSSNHLDVETKDGRVVAVWFRCQQLSFVQTEVGENRAESMITNFWAGMPLTGVEVVDP